MNLVLFEPTELAPPLPRSDPRAQHILTVLRRAVVDEFDVGEVNGPRGKALLTAVTPQELHLRFTWDIAHPPPAPLDLIVGLPRPQTARDILRDATTLGVTALHFVRCARSDANYATSSLWSSGEWRRHTLSGAAQAFDTHVPEVSWHQTLADTLQEPPRPDGIRVAADNYDTDQAFAALRVTSPTRPVTLWIGPERGWDNADRALLDAAGVERRHLGSRVLRTETATVAALSLIQAIRQRSETP